MSYYNYEVSFFFREGGIEFNTVNITQPFAVYFLIHVFSQDKIVKIQSWSFRYSWEKLRLSCLFRVFVSEDRLLQGFLLGLLFSFVVLSFVSHRCSCPKRKVAEPSFLRRHPCSPTYPPFPAPSQPVPRRRSEDNRTGQPTIKPLSPRLLCLVLTSPTTLITRLHCYMSI